MFSNFTYFHPNHLWGVLISGEKSLPTAGVWSEWKVRDGERGGDWDGGRRGGGEGDWEKQRSKWWRIEWSSETHRAWKFDSSSRSGWNWPNWRGECLSKQLHTLFDDQGLEASDDQGDVGIARPVAKASRNEGGHGEQPGARTHLAQHTEQRGGGERRRVGVLCCNFFGRWHRHTHHNLTHIHLGLPR